MPKPFRIAGWIVLALVALIVVAGLVLLVPPHLQVRRVEPPLPTLEQMRALLHHPDGPVAVHYMNTSEQRIAGGTLTHSSFFVEWANGDAFLIDMGMPRDVAKS